MRLPVKKFFRDSLSVGIGYEGKMDAVELDSPVLVKGGVAMKFNFYYADGIALTPNGNNDKHFFEFRLMGAAIASK